MSCQTGALAETIACEHLKNQGLYWITSNYRCRLGEIDLIMRDGKTLVFVEVRARTSNRFGGALASITHAKRQKLIRTAHVYLRAFPKPTPAVRFDVLALEGRPAQIHWIKNAFGTDF